MTYLILILTIMVVFNNNDVITDAIIIDESVVKNDSWPKGILKPGVKIDGQVAELHFVNGIPFKERTNEWNSEEPYIEPNISLQQLSMHNVMRSTGQYSEDEKKEMLRLHNTYRMNVTPVAGNMEWMQWDEKLALMAQAWADGCSFKHGLASSPKYYDNVGQNLYMGSRSSVNTPLYLWYDEFKDYNYHQDYCSKVCGHYTQMVWATSSAVGCARSECGNNNYYVVCHYYPQGNWVGQQPYKLAAPCSLCKDGGLCYNNICATNEDCQRENLDCTCNLKCHNGGELDANSCNCRCKDGWEGLDCSVACRDESEKCNKNPGYPGKRACTLNQGRVATVHCRKMCETCRVPGASSSNTYCNGKICDPGYVLSKSCKCELLCPGPKCCSAYLRENFLVLAIITTLTQGLNI